MKSIQFIGLMLMVILGLSACKKDDVSPPTIILETPTELSFMAAPGDQIIFKGTFTDPKELGKLEFTEAVNAGPTNILKVIEEFDSNKSHDFEETYTISNDAVIGDVIEVGFIGYDVPGNNTISRVSITVQ